MSVHPRLSLIDWCNMQVRTLLEGLKLAALLAAIALVVWNMPEHQATYARAGDASNRTVSR